MGKVLKINSKKLKSDGQLVSEAIETIPALVEELESAMLQLSECWEGAAWAAYQKSTAEQIERLKQIYSYMKQYAIQMLHASEQYLRTEQEIRGSVLWM